MEPEFGNQGLLQLAIGSGCYAVPADQVIALRRITPGATALAYGSLLVPVQPLAALLGLPAAMPSRHALLVAAGSTWQGLAVAAVQTLHNRATGSLLPLPALLDTRRNPDWVRGVLALEPQPLLVLDLEAIVRDTRPGRTEASPYEDALDKG